MSSFSPNNLRAVKEAQEAPKSVVKPSNELTFDITNWFEVKKFLEEHIYLWDKVVALYCENILTKEEVNHPYYNYIPHHADDMLGGYLRKGYVEQVPIYKKNGSLDKMTLELPEPRKSFPHYVSISAEEVAAAQKAWIIHPYNPFKPLNGN